MVSAGLPRRVLGATGLEVSLIGLGTVKFGRNQGVKYPRPFDLPDDASIRHLLDHASDLGINLLDTSPAYGTSESRLGELLTNREDWVLTTKFGETFEHGRSVFDFDPDHVAPSIERSLERLRTDYLDIVLIHSDGRDRELLSSGTLDALRTLKQRGVVRAVGISSKSADGLDAAVDAGCDVVMATLNRDYTDETTSIARAGERGVGVIIKKALASGHRGKDDLRWVAAHPSVAAIVVGTLNPDHLLANVRSVAPAS